MHIDGISRILISSEIQSCSLIATLSTHTQKTGHLPEKKKGGDKSKVINSQPLPVSSSETLSKTK